MSTAGGAWKALQRGRSVGCETVQIFVKNNMQWFGRAPSTREAELFAREQAASRFAAVFGHTGYLINLGARPSANRENSLKSLIQEIGFAAALGLPFLVMHPGAHLGDGEAIGLERIIEGLDEVLAATARTPVKIALEITAGQGSCLGYEIAHLAAIIDGVKTPARLGICLDTAHLFAAGYAIHRAAGWDAAVAEVSKLVGLKRILAFHLNDSKTPLGSRVDRHAHIGLGLIGKAGFRHIVNDPRFRKHPACIETPKSKDLREDLQNLATLRSLLES